MGITVDSLNAIEDLSEEPKTRNDNGEDGQELEEAREYANSYENPMLSPIRKSASMPATTKGKTIRIPDYIFDYAERLRKEKNYTFDQIIEDLRQRGHSNTIIFTIIQRQFPDITQEELMKASEAVQPV